MAGRTLNRRARSTSNAGGGSSRPPTKALVASSAYYSGNVAPRIYGNDKGWQEECYRFYGLIGEARYAANYWGAAMSKCEMFIEEPVTSDDGLARSWQAAYTSDEQLALDDMFSGRNNQAAALASIGMHKSIGGECFIFGKYVGDPEAFEQTRIGDNSYEWQILPPVEMSVGGGGGWIHTDPDTLLPYICTEFDVVIRLWWSDPKRRNRADSPFKASLPVLREIELSTEHIESQLVSRLSGAGILWVPEGIDIPDMPTATDTAEEAAQNETLSGPSRLMKYLGKIMAKAVQDRGSAAARIPIIIQAPDELIDKARLQTFWSELDEKVGDLRDRAIHRFVSGQDLPNESIEGMSSNGGTGGGSSNGVSHWGAWQIEESAIKMHIEPGMDVVCAALTIDWIRVQVPNSDKRVNYSALALKLRPDRSREALELYDRGELSAVALRREVGFSEKDKPSTEERKEWILLQIAKGSNTPEQVAWAAQELGVGQMPSDGSTPVGNEARPAPSLVDHPDQPRTPAERHASRLALRSTCNAMVLQALSRVGNRLINQKAGKVVPPEGAPQYVAHTFAVCDLDTDRLLADAFPHANEILAGIAEPAEVMPVLQGYTASLVSGKTKHDPVVMMRWLEGVETS